MLPDILQGVGGRNRLVQGRHGLILYNKNDKVIGASIEEYGEYYESEVEVFRQALSQGGIAVDVGANIGSHTLAMARCGAEMVYAVEPQMEIQRLLTANVELNGLKNVMPVWSALGEEVKTVKMPFIDYDRDNSSFGSVAPGEVFADNVKYYMIQQLTLDALLRQHQRIALIKIDVEGGEADVLRGGEEVIRLHRPVLYVENDRPKNSADLIALVWGLGYDAYWHLPKFHNPDNFAGREHPIHSTAYVPNQKDPEELWTTGFAINLLCLPRGSDASQIDLKKVDSLSYHPMWKKDVQLLELS